MKRRWALSSIALALAAPQPVARAVAEQPLEGPGFGPTSVDILRSRLQANDARAYGYAPPGAFGRASDPVVDAIATWDRLRRPDYQPSFAELAAWLTANPGWPDEAALRRKAESAVTLGSSFADRVRLFELWPPRTAAAQYRLAEAYRATGRPADALRWAREAWAGITLSPQDQSALLTLFGGQLTPQDHLRRADALLWAGRADDAERMAGLIPPDAQAWLRARAALIRNAPDARALAAALPPSWAGDAGLLYARAKQANDNLDPIGARSLMAGTAVQPGSVAAPVTWIRFRLQLARDALRDGQYDLAYRIADGHRAFPPGRPPSELELGQRDALTDIEWLAGWIALRNAGRPADALLHFSRYAATAQSPTTRTKGLYWAARAAEAGGDPANANRLLAEAARYGETFYGQLAQERLGRPVALPPDGAPDPAPMERTRFNADPRVVAAKMLGALPDPTRQAAMLKALADNAQSAAERRMVADLGRGFGHLEAGVIAGRRGRADGDGFARYAYPIVPLPPALAADDSIVHAITRQESQFNLGAVSAAGARGLMQLMPATAQEQAGKLGLPFSPASLLTDGAYNMQLGASYYERIRSQWGGSHVLAVASYNAGAGNVRRWVRENGDPSADPLAWIESIPYSETRNYVHRVLENAVTYDLIRGVPSPMGRADRLSAYLGKPRPG